MSDVTETGEPHPEPSSSHQYSSSTYTTQQRTIAPSKVQLTKTPMGDSSSSIDSERSGLSVRMQPGAVRRPPVTGYGSETDNLDDYLQVCSVYVAGVSNCVPIYTGGSYESTTA